MRKFTGLLLVTSFLYTAGMAAANRDTGREPIGIWQRWVRSLLHRIVPFDEFPTIPH